MANQLRSRYDIVINGGGVVGFTLLNLILKSPQLRRARVLLIEQAPKPKSTDQVPRLDGELESGTSEERFSNRVSSINRASSECLNELGVWSQLKQFRKEVRDIKVWNYDYSSRLRFAAQDTRSYMFSVLENNRLYSSLVKNVHQLQGQSNCVVWNHSLEQLSADSKSEGLVDLVASNTEDGQQINLVSSLVIGCDGYKSKVRELTNITYRERALGQRGVVGTVKIANTSKNNDIAYQRFSAERDTVAALLPLSEEYCSFVISAPEEYSQWLVECDEQTFIDQFNELLSKKELPPETSLRYLHGALNFGRENLKTLCSQLMPTSSDKCCSMDQLENQLEEPPVVCSVVADSRASFPLASGTTSPKMVTSLPGRQYNQIALLGDSCHRVHPLAGQGLNLGIQDAVELVRNLEEPASRGERLFSDCDSFPLDKALHRFQLNRQLHIVPIHAAISILPTLFKLCPPSLLSAVNMCNPVKTASIKFANGF